MDELKRNIEGDEFAADGGGAAPYSATSVADKLVSANGRGAEVPAAIPAT